MLLTLVWNYGRVIAFLVIAKKKKITYLQRFEIPQFREDTRIQNFNPVVTKMSAEKEHAPFS